MKSSEFVKELSITLERIKPLINLDDVLVISGGYDSGSILWPPKNYSTFYKLESDTCFVGLACPSERTAELRKALGLV